jgi:hypothetical protein
MSADTQNKRRATLLGLTQILPVADGSSEKLDRAILAQTPALASPAAPEAFLPSLTKTDARVVGTWRIDKVMAPSPQASLNLKELRGAVKTKLPFKVFSQDDYPKAETSIWGKIVPSVIGSKVQGCKAYLIDATTNKFKVVGHAVAGLGPFFTADNEFFTPDVIDLANGEFTYSAWDGEDLFATVTMSEGNPIDAVKTLLTDTDRGAGLGLDRLDTTSTGKGFGANGARVRYVRGHRLVSGDEVYSFDIGLYMNEQKPVNEWIQQVCAAAFCIPYTDASAVYQIKAWRPQPSDGLPEIVKEQIAPNSVKPSFDIVDPVTSVTVKYRQNHAFDSFQVYEHTNDRLRQLRGEDTNLTKELPLADRFGAVYWAERTAAMRGVPRYVVNLTVTQEYKTEEPGNFLRMVYDVLNIDTVWEVLAVTQRAGTSPVTLKLIDVRGFGDEPGFWTEAAPLTFPAELGGGSFSEWADATTAAQRKYVRENWGIWMDGNYADEDNSPEDSHRASVWV